MSLHRLGSYISNQIQLFTGVKLQSVMGHIEFVNVSFHYPSREKVSTFWTQCFQFISRRLNALPSRGSFLTYPYS